MSRLALATVVLGAAALMADAQQATLVSGRVLADDTNAPLANARVVLINPAGGSPVLTDRDGHFAVPVPAGPYAIAVTKTGYGRRETTASDRTIEIHLARGVAISGRV